LDSLFFYPKRGNGGICVYGFRGEEAWDKKAKKKENGKKQSWNFDFETFHQGVYLESHPTKPIKILPHTPNAFNHNS